MSEIRPSLLQKEVLKPVELSSWVMALFGMIVTWWIPISASAQRGLFLMMLAFAFYILLYFHWLYPRYLNRPWVKLVPVIVNIGMVNGVNYLLAGVVNVEIMYILIVVNAAVRLGRPSALLAGFLSGVSVFGIGFARSDFAPATMISHGITLIVYLVAGYLSGTMAATLHRQVERMSVLNAVSHAISSTIEMDKLLELIYDQLCRVILTDTYYVGLHRRGDDVIQMIVVFDEGKRYPTTTIPFGNGLSSHVIESGKPLLVRRLSVERKTLGIPFVVVGNSKPSESFLGVPIPKGGDFTGVLAVASYKPKAFNEEDIALLENIASQAAIALDNARHHAQVEEQARQDSLTGAYNHGYLLQRLEQELDRAQEKHQPLSFIMLDIDHFKKYNDTYGHVMGDCVLRLVVQAIQAHLKQTDVVGQWGGEEFGIVLPYTTTAQAELVANRIRDTLVALPLVDGSGNEIPKPTVSQGIATWPDPVADANKLVDVADAMLYQAKQQGRDQVRVADSNLHKGFHNANPN